MFIQMHGCYLKNKLSGNNGDDDNSDQTSLKNGLIRPCAYHEQKIFIHSQILVLNTVHSKNSNVFLRRLLSKN